MTPRADDLRAEALARHRAGDLAGAEQLYRAALEASPDDADALHLLGVLLHQRGDHRGAVETIGRALALRPDHAEAHSNLGLALEATGAGAEAIDHFERALALNPGFANAHTNLGRALGALGRTEEARARFEHALSLDPAHVEAQNNLANLLRDEGRLDEAVALYEAALALRPASAEVNRNLGLALQAQSRLDTALRHFEAAARLAPDRAGSHFDIANALRLSLRLDEAVAEYRRALSLDPGHADTHCNLGVALHHQGALDAAIQCFDRALSLDPDHANAHLNRAMTMLLMGNFAGFAEYEWRWRATTDRPPPRDFGVPQWRGEALAGATILLHAEQGFGDTIQFLRYAPHVAQRGGRVVLMVPPELRRLVAGLKGVAAVVETGAPVPGLAWHAPLMSLPIVLGAPLAAEGAYLGVNAALARRWRARIETRPGVRVGLAWTGRPSHPRERERSLDPDLLTPLGAVPGVSFFALRHGGAGPLPPGLAIDDLGAELGDFADTAAAILALDLVITVDTAVAHLAGALGKPAWVLLTRVPDWRWLLRRADSPWYPTLRLVRQDESGTWPPAVARAVEALRQGVANELVAHGLAEAGAARLDGAIAAYERALEAAPDHIHALNNLANARRAQGRAEEAVQLYRRALAAKPDFTEAMNNLGGTLATQGKLDEAVECYLHALVLTPKLAPLHNNLANALKDLGRIDEAIVEYQRALALSPDFAAAASNLLLCRNYRAEETGAGLLAAHLAWAKAHAPPARPPAPKRARGARLRVGFISPDLRSHSVAYFALPLLEGLDRARVSPVCYADSAAPDAMTARLKAASADWVEIHGHDDEWVFRRIRADGIDVLVDLAGHTGNGRMRLLALKPAPVQASWLGYPNTTGLGAVDLRLTDAIADPPGEADRGYTERLVRLPHFLCYRPPEDAPAVAPRGDGVTFGSFNLLAKLAPAVIALWARILAEVPAARLLLKTWPLHNPSARVRLLAQFAAHGIGPERLVFAPLSPTHAGHLARYGEVDVALDPFPYNGATTTCEALWMGVPVIALRGDRHAARVGASLLDAAGLGALVAETPADYVALAAALAGDPARRAALRATMRARLAAAPLLDGPAFAASFTAALTQACG